ncbi:MAG: transglycosylase SLT domain-containing protein [Bacteroidia bacterium]|nr:transglycosylase SLT domain-containing protein [Bacteroidia bacterium]
MVKKRSKPNKNIRITRFIQIITFLWIFMGILTVLLVSLSSLQDLKIPYTLRMVSYGLSLFLLIFIIAALSRHLLPGIRKALKSPLSKTFYRQVIYVAATLTTLILVLFINETYLRFFSTPVYQDTEYFINKAWNRLDIKYIHTKGGSSEIHDYQFSGDSSAIQSHIYSTDGRFDRTIRWYQEIRAAEAKYHIPQCLIAGLIMQESMGNPLQVNGTSDGGAGLMMFQPGTAQEYGLRTYGTSKNTGRDTDHGQVINELLDAEAYNYDRIRKKDERFDIQKSIDAGARFLSELHNRFGTWDKAISAYNRGTPALIPMNTKHVRLVKNFQRYYCQRIN